MSRILNSFKWQSMIRPNDILGEIPSNKNIYKRTFKMAWPSAIESVLIALIGAVDMMMVGNLGSSAISAVGIVNQPKFIVLAAIFALNTGVTVLVSRRKGENNQEAANKYLRQAIYICIGLSFILSLTAGIFAKEFLMFAGANIDYIDLAVPYFRIILFGNFFYAIGHTMTSAQRGAGNTKISMKTNLAANGVNLIFNALLINGLFFFPQLGVTGAAIATAIGNIVAFSMATYSVTRKGNFLHFSFFEKMKFDKLALNEMYKISSSSFIEQIFIRVGFLTYAMTIANLGTVAFASHQVCMNIMVISFAVGEGLQIASTSLVGQSLGQRRPDLATIYGKVSQKIGISLAILLALVVFNLRSELVSLFTIEQQVITMTQIPMMILSFTILFQVPQVIIVGSLRGAGDVKFVAMMMLISVAIFRPLLSYILAYGVGLGLQGAWIALAFDQVTRYAFSFYRYRSGKWANIIL